MHEKYVSAIHIDAIVLFKYILQALPRRKVSSTVLIEPILMMLSSTTT
ncbi:MAG: hypothetical protein QXN90_07450 [Zestosphaera sp.]